MWQDQYSTTTDVRAETLFNMMADINRWPEWADDLEYTKIEGKAEVGAPFTLKPKGGPKVAMNIETFLPSHTFADLAHLPLAKMRTTKSFIQQGTVTQFTLKVEVWGLLGFFWSRALGVQMIKDAPWQREKMFAYARKIQS